MPRTEKELKEAIRKIFERAGWICIEDSDFRIDHEARSVQFTIRCTNGDDTHLRLHFEPAQLRSLLEIFDGAALDMIVQKHLNRPPFIEVFASGVQSMLPNPI